MTKERKLPSYYHFNINLLNGYIRFTDVNDNDLPDYKRKFTKSQWTKASKYLERTLKPFLGYSYKIKEEYKNESIIHIR